MAAAEPRRQRGHARLRPVAVVAVFAVGIAIAVAVAAASILLAKPARPHAPCESGRPCSYPPTRERGQATARAAAYVRGRLWRSGAGPSLRYDPDEWRVVASDSRRLSLLERDGGHLGLFVRAVPRTELSPLELLDDQLTREASVTLGLARDHDPAHALLGPSIGFVRGIGGAYRATVDAPPSPVARVELLLMGATDGHATVLVEALTDLDPETPRHATTPFPIFADADLVLTTFAWS